MANLPGRNGKASSIHYPLPQPAAVPFSQANKQQWTWNFVRPLALSRLVRGFLALMYRQNPLTEMRRNG